MRVPLVVAAVLGVPSAVVAQTAPTFAPPRVVEERGPSPTYFRLSPRVWLPLLRLATGIHVRPTDATRASVAFSAELNLGVVRRFDRASPHGAFVEAGFSHTSFSQDLGALGLGWIYGLTARTRPDEDAPDPRWRVAVIERAVAGASYGRFAVGVRSGVAVGYWLYALEASHQVLWVDGRDEHELQLTLTSLIAVGEER